MNHVTTAAGALREAGLDVNADLLENYAVIYGPDAPGTRNVATSSLSGITAALEMDGGERRPLLRRSYLAAVETLRPFEPEKELPV